MMKILRKSNRKVALFSIHPWGEFYPGTLGFFARKKRACNWAVSDIFKNQIEEVLKNESKLSLKAV